MKISRKPLAIALSIVMALTMSASGTYQLDGVETRGEEKKTVFTIVDESTLTVEEITEIKEDALTDGANVAAQINEYDNSADFEEAVNAALTSYYENDKYEEITDFEETIDERADAIVEGYKEAAKEREIGDANGFEVGKALVTFKAGTTREEMDAVAEAEYGECVSVFECFNGDYLVEMEISLGQTVDMAVDAFEEYDCIQYASANDYMEVADYEEAKVDTVASIAGAAEMVNDNWATSQYYLDKINVMGAWNYLNSTSHSKVLVGVIDTGVELNHSDLTGVFSPLSVDVTGDSSNPIRLLSELDKTYVDNHGTAVSGVIAAKANNYNGVAGVASAYNNDIVEILAVQASEMGSNSRPVFTTSYFTRAANYCIEKGVKVINFSGGALGSNSTYQSTVELIVNNGIIFVCSAGNDNSDGVYFPGDYETSISVIATNYNNGKASFSNYGLKKDIAAPGDDIYTTTINNGITIIDGTSFSSPIVAGVVAMMCSVNNNLKYTDVKNILQATSKDIHLGDLCRGGLVDAEKAVKTAAQYKGVSSAPNMEYGTLVNAALSGKLTASSVQSETLYPTKNAIDNNFNTYFVTQAGSGQEVTVDLGKMFAINTIYMNFGQTFSGGYKISISNDNSTWQTVHSVEPTATNAFSIPCWYKSARYVKFTATNNTGHVRVSEFQILGYELKNQNLEPEEVEGLRASVQTNGTLVVYWTYNASQNSAGYKYNVYHNGNLTYEKINNETLVFDGTPGTHTFKVTSVWNGKESKGVEYTVVIPGEEPTTETPTTVADDYVVAGSNWTTMQYWSTYFASGWAGNPTGAYKKATGFNNFGVKIDNASNAEWGIQLRSDEVSLEAGQKYKVVVQATSNMASSNQIKFKDDISGNQKLYNLVSGTNTFELEITTNGKAQIFFDLGLAPAGLKFEIIGFMIYKTEQTTTVAPTTQAPTTQAPTTQAPTTQTPTTSAQGKGPDEVFGQLISSTNPGLIDVVWGASANGQTYNVYVDGVITTDVNGVVLKNISCAAYRIPVVAGSHTVRISSVLNGQESAGVTGTVTVTGTTPITTVAPTTQAPTTQAPTTQAPTTEAPTTPAYRVYTVAGANWTDLPYWSTYFASGWAGNPTGEYYAGTSLNDFAVKINNASNAEWGVQLRSATQQVEAGKVYKCTVTATANKASSNQIKFKDDISGKQKLYNIVEGTNTFELEFTAAGTAKIFFDLGLAPAGLELVFTNFKLEKKVDIIEESTTVSEIRLLSEGKTVTSSSVENDSYKASNVVDNNMSSRWSSAWTDNEWICVDLGKVYNVSQVQIDWEAAYATNYTIEASVDGSSWATVSNTYNSDGGNDVVNLSVATRYVRLRGVKRSTTYGYSIYELKVYGK